jgi:hypothetical protein
VSKKQILDTPAVRYHIATLSMLSDILDEQERIIEDKE